MQRSRSRDDQPPTDVRYGRRMTPDDEPTAALTSRVAVIATLLLFGSIALLVALMQL